MQVLWHSCKKIRILDALCIPFVVDWFQSQETPYGIILLFIKWRTKNILPMGMDERSSKLTPCFRAFSRMYQKAGLSLPTSWGLWKNLCCVYDWLTRNNMFFDKLCFDWFPHDIQLVIRRVVDRNKLEHWAFSYLSLNCLYCTLIR